MGDKDSIFLLKMQGLHEKNVPRRSLAVIPSEAKSRNRNEVEFGEANLKP